MLYGNIDIYRFVESIIRTKITNQKVDIKIDLLIQSGIITTWEMNIVPSYHVCPKSI